MEIIIVSTVIFSLAVLALSIGTILDGRKLKGHCGGPSIYDGEGCIKDSQGNKIQSCPECSCEADKA